MPIANYGLLASGGGGTWGSITGTLSSQTDLNDALNGKQATLVSATNIKTINSTSLLGAGDIAISGFADPMTTEGDIIYRTSGGTTTRLARGTDGQVLTATAGSINWETPSGGGGSSFTWTTGTQASSSVDITNKNIHITVGASGGNISLDTIIDETTIDTNGTQHLIKVTNNDGAAITISTTEPNNFGDSYPLNNGANTTFALWKDNTGVIQYGNAGEYI